MARKKVWRFALSPMSADGVVFLSMPRGAEVIHYGKQDRSEHSLAWALVDPEADLETRAFVEVGTGFAIQQTDWLKGHVGTYQDGIYVWHLFEIGIPDGS